MPGRDFTDKPFAVELPRMVKDRGLTMRALVREVGGLDHAYLSRMLHGRTPINVRHVERIACHLGVPADYFPEVREARLIESVRSKPRLRDRLYFEHVKRG